MSTTCGPIAARSRADRRAKSSIVLFSIGNRIDIQGSIVMSRVAGCSASRRASVDFPAAIFPQRRYEVVGRAGSIVTEYQLSVCRQLLLRVRCCGAGRLYRPSALPSIAGVLPHCRELTKWATSGHPPASFNDLVSAVQQRGRHGEAEFLGRLEIAHEIELGRLNDRQSDRLLALENAADIDVGLA